VDEEAGVGGPGRAHEQLQVRPVHRVAGLEGDDPIPAAARELGPQLGRRVPQVPEVVVPGPPQSLDDTADVPASRPPPKVGDAGMDLVRGPEHLLRFGLPVWSPGVVDVQDGQRKAFRVPEHELGAGTESTSNGIRNVEGDRDRPQSAVGQAHAGADRLVVGPAEEAPQRREAAAQQQLDIAELPSRQVPRRPPRRPSQQLPPAFGDADELHEPSPVRCDQMVRHDHQSLDRWPVWAIRGRR
jgi:hypothetical protein